jgi:helicase MOV-10
LPVPGLAEKRPSVITGKYYLDLGQTGLLSLGISGDTILVQMNGAANDRWYEGHVHFVHEAEVALRFHRSFPKNVTQQRFDVRFQLNRMPLRRQHQALRVVHHAVHLLFPLSTYIQSRTSSTRNRLTLYDQKIANNPRQLGAIQRILALPSTSAPFIIFGP